MRCVCGKKIGPDPRNFNQRVSLGRNDLLIRTFLSEHPEYISSAELEQKLYREFAQVTTVPAYKEMSMYQLLVIS
ncbi:hypothetical protein [Escherichia coli]|uniref:hypothetical protein n=1 Tax=Escherichia coli TaxID=562 RepID=UPI001EDDF17D|nr:hypothetical protein [Escherichia coli]